MYSGYCWRSCRIPGVYYGWEYARDNQGEYLMCTDASLNEEADMECVEKGAGTGLGGKTCHWDLGRRTRLAANGTDVRHL